MKYKFKRKKGKKNTNAKVTQLDGITFASGLEAYCYQKLKESNIKSDYEGKTFELVEKFKYPGEFYDKGKTQGVKVYKKKTGNIRNMSYTPDFISEDHRFIIETKGLRTPEFNMRFKLFFRKLVTDNDIYDIYLPSNRKEVDQTIELIKSKIK
jgi:hypothetical protein|tara:strand:- start:4384 stop:4842 length:459 start_codon:yes stop_codon:yes gene_type:complete